MRTIAKKLMVLSLILLVMVSCGKKDEISPPEIVEGPGEETSGPSFSKDEDIKLILDKDQVLLLAKEAYEVNPKSGEIKEVTYKESIFSDNEGSFSLEDGQLLFRGNGEEKLLAQDIIDHRLYEDRLIYSEPKGIYMLQYSRKLPQLIRENIAGEERYELEDFKFMDGGKFYLYYNDEEGVTEIFLTETLEHVTDYEGRVSNASWSNDSFLFEDQGGKNRVGFYQISKEEVSKFNLTTDDERVIESPDFDREGQVRFLTDKHGVMSLNKLDPDTQMVKKINMMKTEDLLEEAEVDGVVTFRFKSYFYYSYDDKDYNFYALETDKLNFSDSYIFAVKGDELKVIEQDSFKAYSLKGKPLESLGTDQAFYYTYSKDGKNWLDVIEIDF